jgi:DNA repair protein RadC
MTRRRLVTVDFVRDVPRARSLLQSVDGPADAAAIAHALWTRDFDFDREHFVVLAVDARGKVFGEKLISVGTLTATIVHPREVFRAAILMNAATIIVVHNHPSGDPTPSDDDWVLYRRLAAAGDVLGIPVVDSLIVTRGSSWVSMQSRAALR